MSDFSFSALQEVAKQAGFTVIDPGDYEVKVEKSSVKDTQTGKKMIKVLFKVVAGPLAGKGTVWNQFVISPDSPNALFFFFKHMKALGLDDAYFASNPTPEKVAESLIGRRCKITVGIRKWNDQDQNEVKVVSPPDTSVVEQVTNGDHAGNGSAPGVPDMSAAKPAVSKVKNKPAAATADDSDGDGDEGNGQVKEPAMAGAAAANTSEMPPPPF